MYENKEEFILPRPPPGESGLCIRINNLRFRGRGIYKYIPPRRDIYILNAARRARRRPDKITAPESYTNPIRDSIFHALAALDAVATRYEEKWGVHKLQQIVPPETASRFGSAKAKLDAAIEADDADEVARRASVLARGWEALDKEATAAGHQPEEVEAWLWRDEDGKPHAFVRDSSDAIKYGKEHKGVIVWSMAEVVRTAAAFQKEIGKLGTEAKATFPGATIVDIRDKEVPSDELPF